MNLPVQNAEIPMCRRLRTKQTFMHADTEVSWKTGESATATYWCLRTMGAHGPDEAYVHPKECKAGRTCFELAQ
jgi:hypothetical protein